MTCKAPPIRFWIAVMIFMTTFTNYMLRANISVSIVRMVAKKNQTKVPYCLRGTNFTLKTATTNYEHYDWDEKAQGQILSAYFYGYVPFSLVAGILTEYVGTVNTIVYSSFAASLLNALTPLVAKGGWGAMVGLRALIGALGGLGYPAVNDLIARWAPPKEKGKFLAAMMGNTLGTVICWFLVGTVTQYWGWPWGFYTTSMVVVVFCAVCFFVAADTPSTHKWISEEELAYILESQGTTLNTTKAVPPYLKIFMSLPFWAVTVAQLGNLYGLNLLLTYAPKFMAQSLGFNIRNSSYLASMPYLARLITSFVFGYIGDLIRKRNLMPLTKTRKIFIIFSHVLPALCLFGIIPSYCSHAGVVALMILSQAFNGAVVLSHLQNPQDLSPNFAGAAYGIMNAFGGCTGFIVSAVTGAVMGKYEDDGLLGPHIIFSIGGSIFFWFGMFFVAFGKTDIQPWNEKIEKPAPAATAQ